MADQMRDVNDISDLIATLNEQSRGLAAAARIQPKTPLTEAERQQVEAYDRWLLEQSRKTLELARTGEAATTPVARKAVKEQFIKLQMAMQRENQLFTSVSNILKTKHDSAKNSISNVR